MRIVLLHYHILRGGVTTVLARQAEGLAALGHELLVLCGELGTEDTFPGIPIRPLPLLAYDVRQTPAQKAKENSTEGARSLADALHATMLEHFGVSPDILLIHNPLIRKNSLLLPALALLREKGHTLFIQNHDFAEDWRADLYLRDTEYPEDCHYGTINGRDRRYLLGAGLEAGGVHLLPNTVLAPKLPEPAARNRFLYPVRAIRRKNLGEALLLSSYLPGPCTLALTLPPTSPRDLPVYRLWKRTARQLALPVEFDIGLKEPFDKILSSARAVVTTSVKEGFGFSYLEPWLAGRPVMGRRIEYVCGDFEAAGVRFPDLYRRLVVPRSLFPDEALRSRFMDAYRSVWRLYGRDAPKEGLDALEESLFANATIDFSRLDEEFQLRCLQSLAESRAAKSGGLFALLADMNPFLAALATWKEDPDLTRANSTAVAGAYSLEATIGILSASLETAIAHPVGQRVDRKRLLDEFLDPFNFSLTGTGHD